MKGDFTRDTFKQDKHFQQVLMQQGRVQLDADWNEQAALAARRDETTAADLVGNCGGPAEGAAFAIITTPAVLAGLPDPTAPSGLPAGTVLNRQLALSAGRYYVDGLQCEVESPFLFSWQPDLRKNDNLEAGKSYLIYLDVWRRHVSVHEDGDIREAALGGPDTGTRVKTIWQVRAAALEGPIDPNNLCHPRADGFDRLKRTVLPRLAAKTTDATPDTDPCAVPASAGYRGLENQLYRVEIHTPGALGSATFKWSRENGAVVTRIRDSVLVPINGVNVNRLTVTSTGPDDNLGFKKGSLVEIIHESEELEGTPGALAVVDDVDDATGKITLAQFGANPMPLAINLESKPRLCRWERFGTVAADPALNHGFLALENGIEIKFDQPAGAEFRTGDYWQIPSRTASPDAQSGRIEWPGGAAPESLPPRGIVHHYCRLGVVSVSAGGAVTPVSDCRCLWPALTSVPRLFYVSGDGQEVMPDPTAPASTRFKLPRPLIVGVAEGHCLERATRVRFQVVNTTPSPGAGLVVAGGAPTQQVAIVPLDANGLASADFHLDGVNPTQQVSARLLDGADNPVSLPVIFNASLSVAALTAYDPSDCAQLQARKANTVQKAIDELCKLGHGGGCHVVVGKGGQYELLDTAILDLIEKDVPDICICLLPGDHKVTRKILPQTDRPVLRHLEIQGCGPASRIIPIDIPLNFTGLESLTLHNLSIRLFGDQATLNIADCDEVSLSSCRLWSFAPEPIPQVIIDATDRIDLSENTIESSTRGTLERPRKVFDGLLPEALFDRPLDPSEFRPFSREVAQKLDRLNLAERKQIADHVQQVVKALELPPREAEPYQRFASTLTNGHDPADRSRALYVLLREIRISAAIHTPGLALILPSPDANTRLVNNDILGLLSCYGLPAASDLTNDQLQQLGKKLQQREIQIQGSAGTLHANNNRLTRLLVGGKLLTSIASLLPDGMKGDLNGVHKAIYFTNNTVATGDNQWIAQSTSLATNYLDVLDASARIGFVVASKAVYLGNQGPFNDRYMLSNLAPEALNQVELTIPPSNGVVQRHNLMFINNL